jgi:hypothetical protein
MLAKATTQRALAATEEPTITFDAAKTQAQEMPSANRVIKRLNALAKRIPRAAFMTAGALDRVTYVIVYEGEVLYAGEGYPHRATKRFKVQGLNDPDFDYVIEQYYGDPLLEIYYAASNITKAVAVEFEGILIDEFKPLFNTKPKSSIWATQPMRPADDDTFSKILPAEKLDYKFGGSPPRLSTSHCGNNAVRNSPDRENWSGMIFSPRGSSREGVCARSSIVRILGRKKSPITTAIRKN